MPNAGDAYLNGDIPIANNPLNRITQQPPSLTNDVQAFIQMWTDFFNNTALPILEGIIGVPLTVLKTLWDGFQNLIDAIVNALTGGSAVGNDLLSLVLSLLNPMQWLQGLTAVVQSVQTNLSALLAGHDGRLLAVEAALAQLVAGTSTAINSGGDNFNRPGPAIGSDWTSVAGTLLIKDSAYVQTNALAAGYFNTISPATDKHGTSVRLVNKWPGMAKAFICSDTAMSNYAAVEVYADFWGSDYIRLSVGSSPGVTIAQKQANFQGPWLNGTIQNGAIVQLKYDDAANTFYVLKDGVLLDDLIWEDTGNLVTHGATKRRCGIVSCSDSAWSGFGITDYLNFDWT